MALAKKLFYLKQLRRTHRKFGGNWLAAAKRFYGLTGGYEFASLIEAIMLVSLGMPVVEPAIAGFAGMIKAPTHIETVVTLSCPYCPVMVRLIHQMAFVNENIRADMIDGAEFPHLVNRYDVHGVPVTVVNGRRAFEGALEPGPAVLGILKVVDPDAYAVIETKLREAQGLRHAREVSSGELYDVIVVGAGPAGLTAALYAQRKGLKTALFGKQAGGQVNDTASVENYPGFTQIGGAELARAMREHVEAYPVSERSNTQVARILRDGALFQLVTEDEEVFRGRSLIFCTGKRYRRLNVPGEERFLGRGIAWCATCDAPLYQDKRVAVVGGGNSALTAVRDLLRYASEIHLVHHKEKLNAEAVLLEEIRQAEADGRVTIDNPAAVQALRTMMREVVTDGTGQALRDVPGEPVHGKTGTAEYDDDPGSTIPTRPASRAAALASGEAQIAVGGPADGAAPGKVDPVLADPGCLQLAPVGGPQIQHMLFLPGPEEIGGPGAQPGQGLLPHLAAFVGQVQRVGLDEPEGGGEVGDAVVETKLIGGQKIDMMYAEEDRLVRWWRANSKAIWAPRL